VATVIESAEAMFEWGRNLGELLHPGDVLVLTGPLGAGKTLLTQGIGAALGITGVTSPTFVISRIHQGVHPLVHVDAYRLTGDPAALFDDLDLESLIEKSIIVIEWGETFASRIADEYLNIVIDYGTVEDQRIITVTGVGTRWGEFNL
jgi:tRNA threonylcarbamoyladenosine biosynthesis protein TsaE